MPTARMFFTASIEEQWRSVAGPWLRAQAGEAWKSTLPTVVLTPSRAEGFYLRGRLLAEGIPLLGIRFWTPSDARKFLIAEMSPESLAATQPELRLMARLCAEKLLGREKRSGPAMLFSVAQEPGAFLRAYDLLLGAGWGPVESGATYGRGLARDMERALEKTGLSSQAGMHRLLRSLAEVRKSPLIANLLLIGFNATHWPLWDLLRATVRSAQAAMLSFLEPRAFGGEIDQLWISSWEEALRLSVEVPEGAAAEKIHMPWEKLAGSYESGASIRENSKDLRFLVTPELTSQAQAVVLQALDYLKHDSCTRLGIIFPEADALALEVATQLRQLNIPLNDGTGAIVPGLFEQRAWLAWLTLQEEPSIAQLSEWLRACDGEKLSSGLPRELSVRRAVDLAVGALGESLVDDLDFIGRCLKEDSSKEGAGAMARFLERRVALPPRAKFADFLKTTRDALTALDWNEHLALLPNDPPAWMREVKEAISRRTFLAWLREMSDSREKTRGPDGNHFYGKVHLVIYAQMTGQTWSHLILTGLNENVWPRLFDAEAFGSRHDLAVLNQEARRLNRLGVDQGSQGEGHEIVREDHGHCLLPLEKLDLSLRDLCTALESTTESVCLAAVTGEAGRTLLPSDFFNYGYQARTGKILDEDIFRELARETLRWCREHARLLLPPQDVAIDPSSIVATRTAYDARRNDSRPFGPYEFAFAESPPRLIQLSCKTWEDAWNHPATVWLGRVVGVEAWPDGHLSWAQAIGTWAHRWLALALRGCEEGRGFGELPALVRKAAEEEAKRAQNRARMAGLRLYPWWNHVWEQARAIALGLAENLVPQLEGKSIRSEFKLPRELRIALPGSSVADFDLTGRIDLLVFDEDIQLETGAFPARNCWVVDFKTGSAPGLTARKIRGGLGLQAVLYGLAVKAMGAGTVAISLHTFDTPLKPQAQVDETLDTAPIFRSLETFHRAGIFGMRSDARSDYGYSPDYPMATQFVPAGILAAKWELVHGTGAGEEAE